MAQPSQKGRPESRPLASEGTGRPSALEAEIGPWRYSAHELGAIDLITRERVRSRQDDVAWGDLWCSMDPLRFGLRNMMNAAKHALVIAPSDPGLALVLFQHRGDLQGQETIGASVR